MKNNNQSEMYDGEDYQDKSETAVPLGHGTRLFSETCWNPNHIGRIGNRHTKESERGFNNSQVDANSYRKQFSNDIPHPAPDETFVRNPLGNNKMNGKKNSSTVFD